MNVLAAPRDRNPYQELLYGRMRAHGHRVRYVGELTRSRTLNLLALPIELLVRRLGGDRILHLHWTFGFQFPGASARPGIARLSRWWFGCVLAVARACGIRVVWTAHNLYPQWPVFDDDAAARRTLVARADLVIAHTQGALDAVSAAFGAPARGAVIPHGPFEVPGLNALPAPASGAGARTLLFLGRIEHYKGVDDLLAAMAATDAELNLTVAGECRDAAYAAKLAALAAGSERVTLRLDFVPEAEMAALFAAADAVVYPYRKVTTSGAVTLAALAGRPIIVPDLPGFADLPDAAVIRYPPGAAGLTGALERVATAEAATLADMGEAARATLAGVGWESIAARTEAAFGELLSA